MIILDSNVLSELLKAQPAPQVVAWMAKQPEAELFTTAITESEIFFGVELLPLGKRREGLRRVAEAIFGQDFRDRIFGFESDAARLFAIITAQRRALGRPINYADAQIAAITRARGAKLATRNIADFKDCGIDLIDPWNI